MNYEELRHRMVEEQLKARDISDKRVLVAMQRVPRHKFVEKDIQERAYDDSPLPIGKGQTISQPYIVALMTQNLDLSGPERVLEVGTGSGYQAAILAELTREVFTIERDSELSAKARLRLEELGYKNVRLKVGDGTLGWEESAPYDRIIITAGAPQVPQSLLAQLSEDGKLIIPLGGTYYQDLVLIEKREDQIREHTICGCTFVPLVSQSN